MTITRYICAACVAAPLLLNAGAGYAQDNRQQGGFLDNLFSRGNQQGQNAPAEAAGEQDLVSRLDRLENMIRQLTGTIEQLQFRNQQLEQQLKRMADDNEYRFQQLGSKGAVPPGAAPPNARTAPQSAPPQIPPPAAQPGRRSDVFDPSQNPNAPGAPRTLGGSAVASNAPAANIPAANGPPAMNQPLPAIEDIAVGAPGGRAAGAPLDLSTLAGSAASAPPGQGAGSVPAAPGGQQLATLPPSKSPKDEYDLAYGYVLRKDYALAEQTFRDFLKKFKGDKLEPDAHYWLGETYFQRQRYQDAADSFLIVVKNFENTGKAPDSLLRLGQSLAAIGQKELACASYNEVPRKYPRASSGVKRAVEAEQKRAKC